MQLYLSIALGITLGAVGQTLVNELEGLAWRFKNRHRVSPLTKWLDDLDKDDDLLEK